MMRERRERESVKERGKERDLERERDYCYKFLDLDLLPHADLFHFYHCNA